MFVYDSAINDLKFVMGILSFAQSALLSRLYPEYDDPPLCPPGSNASPTGAGPVRVETITDPIVKQLQSIGFRSISVPGGTLYLAASPDLIFEPPPILVRPGKPSPIRPPCITLQPPQPPPVQPPAMMVKVSRPKPINVPPMCVKIPPLAPINLKPICVKVPPLAPIQPPPITVQPKTPCPINPPEITVIPPCQPPIQPPLINLNSNLFRNVSKSNLDCLP